MPSLPLPIRKPAPSPMGDTEPYFLVQPLEEHLQDASTSQMSLGTYPNAGGDETLAVVSRAARIPFRVIPLHHSADHSRMLMLVGAVIVVVLLSAVAISMIYTMLTG